MIMYLGRCVNPETWVEQTVVQKLLQEKVAEERNVYKLSSVSSSSSSSSSSPSSSNLLLVGQVTRYLVSLRKVLRRSAVR